ncbi:MAG: addiction module protein [Candidatus Omnitrophota bacterium]
MSMTVEQIYQEALRLPDDSKAFLAEQLIQYLESHIDKDIERIHLDTAKRRRDEIRSGQVQPIKGEEALARVRQIIGV